jgi:hypothetical protein
MGGASEERRKYRRLDIRTDILCRRMGGEFVHSFPANSINISTDGLLAEVSHHSLTELNDGEIFGLEMDVPSENHSDLFYGKLSTYGKVVRIVHQEPHTSKKHVAFQFCCRPMYEI